jgi:hypothetical protein
MEIDLSAYGFHELVARGLARPAMLDEERKRLLLEYLTPAEIADFDTPIDRKLVDSEQADPKLGAPERIAYRRFAKSKGLDPDDEEAISAAFGREALLRLQEKEEGWFLGPVVALKTS